MQIGSRFGVNTYSYTQMMTAGACLRHLGGLGVAEVELMLYPGHLWIGDGRDAIADVRRALQEAGIRPLTVNTPNIDLNIAAAAAEARTCSLDLNAGFLRLAGEIGAQAMILGPGKPNQLFPLPKHVLEGHFFRALDALLPIAQGCGVEIWVENMPFAFLPGAADLMASLARYGAEELRVCYDVANAHFVAEDPVDGLATVASRLALVHLSDTTRSAFRHDAVGQGDLDFARLPEAIRAAGYTRPCMLEVISRTPDRDLPASVDALLAAGF
ncbi:sugar phosphate isomerase/epimerase family protein [Polymorphum gilvum]|uniref:Xylose isomerase domain protein TIM barrel n=1 Tax=Polymorphum gilvum (strain LMG 25793 / CGMCC 1.9160 / SL003B-26A1) TaxID=991905 RepID=F2J3D4_POLGS|nr:sugar phosphate isomerase/epimerase family protein [Polymorphum gilvum]ADZ70959.1 Xylose isomerase domain protein TIM barrel [Polymorphum gilvum SL003B-26A1]